MRWPGFGWYLGRDSRGLKPVMALVDDVEAFSFSQWRVDKEFLFLFGPYHHYDIVSGYWRPSWGSCFPVYHKDYILFYFNPSSIFWYQDLFFLFF